MKMQKEIQKNTKARTDGTQLENPSDSFMHVEPPSSSKMAIANSNQRMLKSF